MRSSDRCWLRAGIPVAVPVAMWVGVLVGGSQPVRAQEFADVEIATVPVRDGVFILTGRGGNIGVSAGEDGVVLIDDQYAPLTERIRAAVAALHAGEIRFVLNTHWHGDHTGGNENLGKAGVVIVAHDRVRARMATDQFMEAFQRAVPASPAAALPQITFSHDVTFHLNGDEIDAFHVEPAHTDGDSIVRFRRANVIHTGDTFFNGRYPFIDLSSGGSVDGMLAAQARVLALADEKTRIIPGHGPLAGRAELEAARAMLATVRDRVAAAIEEGRDVEAVVAAKPTADLDEQWGGGFMAPDRFVRIVYASLKAERE